MRDVPEELLRGPFRPSRAAELGVGEQVLRGRRFATPFRGVRAPTGVADGLEVRCRAAALALPAQAAVSHGTALQLWRLPTRAGPRSTDLHVTVPRGITVPRLAGLCGHDALLPDSDVVVRDGVRVVLPERTLCDLATQGWPVVDLLAVADALATAENPDDVRRRLTASVEGWAGRRGAVSLRRVLELMDAPVLSAMETRVRFVLVEAGLPRPVVNEIVCDDRGRFRLAAASRHPG